MSTKLSYWTGSVAGYEYATSASITAIAQTFTIAAEYNIEYVVVLGKRNNPATTVTVSIHTLSAGNPAVSLGSKSVDASGWSTSATAQVVVFDSSINLSAGTYAIVITEGTATSIGFGLSGAGIGPGIAKKNLVSDGLWYDETTPDSTFYYEVWGAEAPTLPGKPINPTPADTANDVTLHGTTVTWETGGDTDSYDLYFGSLSGFLTLVESGITDTSGILQEHDFPNYNDFYYWRVDAVNENGTTTGDEWTFTTMSFAPPIPGGMSFSGDPDDPFTDTPNGENNMVTIRRLTALAKNTFFYEDI